MNHPTNHTTSDRQAGEAKGRRIFCVRILDNDSAMEGAIRLPGYSHVSAPKKITRCYYPFEEWVRDAYVTGRNEREVRKAAERLVVWGYVGVSEYHAEPVFMRRHRLRVAAEKMVAESTYWTVEGKRARKFAALHPTP
jgi:hypothetical protein